MSLSKRVVQINPSATLAITAKAKAMKAEGMQVIGFGAGEPDFDTPEHIKQAAKRALDEGFTKYTPSSGIKELKEAICQKFKSDNSLEYLPEEILVSCGAKHSIFNAIFSLCDEADEVILPSPYWVSYPEMIKAAGAKAVILETRQESNFKITPKQLSGAVTPKTKLLILNSPSNPTGCVYTKEELAAIAKILAENNIFCLSDEIYEKIIYDQQEHMSIASLDKKIKDLSIVVNGVSKTYSMTGWRIGYAAGPVGIIKAMTNLQSHSTSNPSSISQKAAIAALCGPQKQVEMMVGEFKKRRDYITETLNKISGFSCLKPQGAFYVFVNISKILGRLYQGRAIKDSFALAEALLSAAQVAVVPGGAFGADDYLRLSYATSMKNIIEGLRRIEEFINKTLLP
ncbi:MAG: pyridoxal phosphate-dependent aminotransferase [Candidatus Omnitrophota bacterium]|jgi:aspartate aminotransferase